MSSNTAVERGLTGQEDRVLLALRLGWTMAEVCGRLRHPVLWQRTPPQIPRLFIGDLSPTSGEQLWTATHRLLVLWHRLFESQPRGGSACAPSEAVAELPERMEVLMGGGAGSPPPAEGIYAELNRWSRDCWAQLDAEASVLAESAVLGASLADTFWHMQPPGRATTPSRKQTWRYLLGPERLIALLRAVRRIEPWLPEHVGRMLRHSLWEWSIARELTLSRSGRVKIACPVLYALRGLYPLRSLRRWAMKKRGVRLPELAAEQEKHLWTQLRKQMLMWECLVFARPVAQIIRPSDWRWVRWVSVGVYAVSTVLFVAAGSLFLLGVVIIARQAMEPILSLLDPPRQLGDWLAWGSALIAVAAFVGTQVQRSARRLRALYATIHGWVLACKLDQRSLQAWDGRTKSVGLIWLQRLLRAEDQQV